MALDDVIALVDRAVGDVFPAAQLVVVDGGEQVLAHAAGTTLGASFDLASLTKPLGTAALVLQLVREGKLDLRDRPRPECTIEQLLGHAGGLPAVLPLADFAHPSASTRREAIERARIEPLAYAPGSRSLYSDLGFILLGDAVERAGVPLRHGFARLARGRAIGFGPDPLAEPTEGPRGIVHDDNCKAMLGVAGHAGLFGDARAVSSLVRDWVEAWHGDEGVLDPALVRRAWAPSTIPGSTWGLGWDHPSPRNSSAGTRWPREGVGHLGFTGCSIWIDPARRRHVVLLSNRVHPTRANERIKAFRPQLHDAVVDALG